MRRIASLLLLAAAASAQPAPPDPTAGIGIDQRLGERVPLEARFLDERGRPVALGDYFGERPVVIALVYYECPMLCTLILNGLVDALRNVELDPGRDFEVVAISIDPGETPDLARGKKRSYVSAYGRGETSGGWHFLVGEEEPIRAVAAAVGYRYRYDPSRDEYAHAAGIVIATPDGRLSRYFYGVEYPPRDLRLGLVEASEGRVGSLVDRILLFCLHYDPATGKYGFVIWNALRLAGGVTVAVLALFVLRMLRRDRRAAAAVPGAGS